MIGDFNFLRSLLRFSVLNILVIPIYIFASEKYKNKEMLAIAILSLLVIVTTVFYWTNKNKNNTLWKYSDRLIVLSILIILLYYGRDNKNIIGFISLGCLYYFLGMSDTFKESDSYLNHMLFRYFCGLALIIYVADEPYRDIFIGIMTLFLLICIYYSVKDITYSSRKSIIF